MKIKTNMDELRDADFRENFTQFKEKAAGNTERIPKDFDDEEGEIIRKDVVSNSSMLVLNLGEIDEKDLDAAGGKSRGLDMLVKHGFNVPRGFVVIDADLDEAGTYYLNSGLKKVAVRSSATSEDGVDFSFAGQFKTVLNVKGVDNFKKAMIECLESLENVKTYIGNQDGIKMSIVVQEMVDADYAGVCFTTDPNNPEEMLIEAVAGLGESLVSGTQASDNSLVTAEIEKQMRSDATKMQEIFQTPLDTEWAVKDGELFWLQARPITVIETCEEDEFDAKMDLTDNMITRCNIGEMLPGAITPLSNSISLYAIDWGMREMMRIAGAVKKIDDLPPYFCALSVRGHLFLNLSSTYLLEKSCFFTSQDNVNFSICGQTFEEKKVVPGKKAWFGRRLRNTVRYIKFLMSRNKARVKLTKIADSFVIDTGQEDPQELYNSIDSARATMNRISLLHYVTSAHSGAMSSTLMKSLQKKIADVDKCKGILAQLLERIDDIESVDILASLRRIAKAIIKENPDAMSYNAEQLSEFLKQATGEVKDAHEYFLARHGHRAIREAELRNKGWAEDEAAFIEYLKTVIGGNGEVAKNPVPDCKAILKSHGFKRTGFLMYLTKNSREGVKNREYSKSKFVKGLDAFKKAYNRLATMLVSMERLPDEDAIFFLTHDEIGELVKTANNGIVKKAVQRRRLLNQQSELRFQEIYTGKPEPLPPLNLEDMGDVWQGTAISRGTITGPARVVRNSKDASELQKGEIMVAVFTDIGWSPFYCLIEGMVTEIGSALSHGAVVAREYALPFVSNIQGATSIIKTGDIITVNGSTGSVARAS